MAKGRLSLLKTTPSPRNHQAILAEFCAQGEGLITALDSKHLGALRYLIPGDTEVELLEFGRMIAAYARLAGTDPKSIASSGHAQVAIAQACQKLDSDSPFYGSRIHAGLHRRLLETTKELGDWGLDPNILGQLATECSPDLEPKLRTLAAIWAAYEARLEEFNCELSYRHVNAALKSVPNPDVTFPRCLIFLDEDVTPKHVEWLLWAAEVGGRLTVVLPAAPSESGLFPSLPLIARLLGIHGIPVGQVAPMARSLFAGTIADPPGIQVDQFQASDPLSEVEWALRQALESTECQQFHRIGLFARNLDDYGPLIEAAADRLGIPIRISRRAPLASNGYIRAMRVVLQSLASGDVRRMEVLLKISYFQFPSSHRREFHEALSESYRSGEQAWTMLADWSEKQKETVPWLPEILRWYREAIAKSTSLVSWRERIRELGNLFPAISGGKITPRDIRAKNSFERAFGASASLAEEPEYSFAAAMGEIESILEGAEYTLPSAPYGIQVSDSPTGFANVDRLFVLGMLEGVFPKRRSENPILTDQDRIEIGDRRALLFPLRSSFDLAKRERDSFITLCSVPSQAITFSYPETSDDRDNIKAFYLEEVKRALGGTIEHHKYPRGLVAPTQSACMAPSDIALRTALDSTETAASQDLELSGEIRAEWLPSVPEALRPRDLRTAFECPFRHFAQQQLSLYPDRDQRRWYHLRTLPQDAQLLRQRSPEEAQHALSQILANQLEEMKPHVTDSEWELLRQGGERLLEEWVHREFRAREIWPKDAGSERAGVSFGDAELRGELPRVGKIAGTVAGTSRMGRYRVVHMMESNTPTYEKTALLGLKDRDALYYGTHLMAAFAKDSAVALEVESVSGGRKLFLLPRLEEPALVGEVESGLEVMDLAGKGVEAVTKEIFFERVKDLLQKASKAIREVDVRATPGDHCNFCDHGELCRQSAEFGEAGSVFEESDE